MQYEKTTDQLTENNHLELIKISPCRKFHTLFEKPLYEERFLYVEKFHNPGFAPVCDMVSEDEIQLFATVITSSPTPIPNIFIIIYNESVPFATETQ